MAAPALPSSVHNVSVPTYGAGPRPGFVTAHDSELFLNGESFAFRTMNAPALSAGPSAFENADTLATFAAFGVPATRVYVLAGVQNDMFGGHSSGGLITGWDDAADDWVYSEDSFVLWDRAFAQAAEYGVKIIVPIVNQDYGTADSDWVGNFVDLIRHRFGIQSYTDAQMVDWWTNTTIRDDFKKIITKSLARTNTINGRVWGKDDTILAWETGNEMNQATSNGTNGTLHRMPAPAEWTLDIAHFIKELAPDTLVMDGSFSRNYDPVKSFPIEVLQSDVVDLFSYHYYGTGDIAYFKPYNDYVKSFGKTFIIGEHGFYTDSQAFAWAYGNISENKIAGSGIWGMRPHSEKSGFLTHGEGGGVFSYHFPGWNNSPDPEFQTNEGDISKMTYQASWEAIGRTTPPYPIPALPVLSDASNSTGAAITWRGATWADHYELYAASVDAPFFACVGQSLHDNVGEGKVHVPVTPSNASIIISVNTHSSNQHSSSRTNWHDSKWKAPAGGFRPSRRSANVARPVPKRDDITIGDGSWYVLRGVNVDGVPGPFSAPLFVKAANGTSSA